MSTLPQPRTALDAAAMAAFFAKRPAARATFEALRREVATYGPCDLVSTKSRVAFLRRTRFLWCHEAHLDGTLTVGFLLPSRVESPRLRSGLAGSRWSHHVKFGTLDAELRSWLQAAYDWDTTR